VNDNAAARRAADRANQWEQTNNRRLLAAHMRVRRKFAARNDACRTAFEPRRSDGVARPGLAGREPEHRALAVYCQRLDASQISRTKAQISA